MNRCHLKGCPALLFRKNQLAKSLKDPQYHNREAGGLNFLLLSFKVHRHSVISHTKAYKVNAATPIKTTIEPNNIAASLIKLPAVIFGSFVTL